MDSLFAAVTDPDCQIRQAACYGVNVAARIHEFGTVAKQAVQRLIMTISQPNSKNKKNLMPTENAVAALGNICEKHEAALGTDAGACWNQWIQNLPLTQDEEEGQVTHAQLLRLVQAQHASVLGPNTSNLPKIVHVFTQVYKRDSCSEETSQGIAKVLMSLPEATLSQMINGFPVSDKKKAVRIIQEIRAAAGVQ